MDYLKKGVVLMLAFTTFLLENQAADVILTNPDGGFRYRFLGCYGDNSTHRTLPKLFFNARKYIKWYKDDYNFKKVIDMCAVRARNRGDLSLFGVQHYGECWGGKAGSNYKAFGQIYEKSRCVKKGVGYVGAGWVNAVYELIQSECEVSGVKYKSGQKFYIPQNPVQFNDIGCQSCSCDRGAKSCLSKIKCDFSFPCEKFIPASQKKNQCCPTCACSHHNTSYKDGQSWIDRRKDACYECTCVSSQAMCKTMECKKECPNPVYEPDHCCPSCHPGAPTQQPAFTIPETTTRPPPPMPPFPGFPGNQKRTLKLKKRVKRSNN